MKKKTNVTQAQIAKMLNISTVTVSKALRNHPDISYETTQRVKKFANKLNYTPDLIARALSARNSNIIGVVMPEIDHTFFSAVMKGIHSVSLEKQFQIILTISQEDNRTEIENLQTLIAMRVDGILISISEKTVNYDIFKTIKNKKIPLVFFDRTIPNPDFGSVVVDDRSGAAGAVEYAIGQGYRHIIHLAGSPRISVAEERKAGYMDALKRNGIRIKNDWIIDCGFSEEDGYRGFRQWISKNDPPEAVFAVNDPVAIGVYDAAKELGIQIPHDMGVIGFSDNIISRYLSPPLTTVIQPAVEIGKTAFHLLLEAIHHPDTYKPRQMIVPTKLIVRDSCLKTARIKKPVND